MFKNKWLIVGSGLVISIIFLWVGFSKLNPREVWNHIQEVEPIWLALGSAIYFLAVSVISLRWQFLLRAIQLVSLTRLIPLVSIGYMGNNVYPFRSGEILRIMLLQRNHGISVAKATTITVVERIFDGLTMLTFILIGLLLTDISSPQIRSIATITAPIFVISLAVFFFLAARPAGFRKFLAIMARVLPGKLRSFALHVGDEVITGLESLRSPTNLLGAAACSLLSWSIEASVYWIVSFAFNLQVSYPVMLVVVGVVNLAGLIPASPGQIGVFEFFVALVLTAAGVPQAMANAYALVVHVIIWLPVTLTGFIFLVRQGLNLGSIRQARKMESKVTV